MKTPSPNATPLAYEAYRFSSGFGDCGETTLASGRNRTTKPADFEFHSGF
jgi:hypothetical protein